MITVIKIQLFKSKDICKTIRILLLFFNKSSLLTFNRYRCFVSLATSLLGSGIRDTSCSVADDIARRILCAPSRCPDRNRARPTPAEGFHKARMLLCFYINFFLYFNVFINTLKISFSSHTHNAVQDFSRITLFLRDHGITYEIL